MMMTMRPLSLFGEYPLAPAPPPEAPTDYRFTSARVRTRLDPTELESLKGRVLGDDAYDILLHGPTELYRADGKLLAKYLPGALRIGDLRQRSLDTLRHVSRSETDNRGLASGYQRRLLKVEGTRTRTPLVASAVAGYMDPGGAYRYCRLTAYTKHEWERWAGLHPMFRSINDYFKKYVPDRYAAQEEFVKRTHVDWIVGDTVFTTITVNRSYPTGVHTDSGDLDAGFSTLAVWRSGSYSGGIFTFPEYRVGVDMQDGDLLLMDAHEWHGNTAMVCNVCGEGLGSKEFFPSHAECGSERISVVSYYRTKMAECGSYAEEEERARRWAEKRIDLHAAEGADYVQARMLEEMAVEATGAEA